MIFKASENVKGPRNQLFLALDPPRLLGTVQEHFKTIWGAEWESKYRKCEMSKKTRAENYRDPSNPFWEILNIE